MWQVSCFWFWWSWKSDRSAWVPHGWCNWCHHNPPWHWTISWLVRGSVWVCHHCQQDWKEKENMSRTRKSKSAVVAQWIGVGILPILPFCLSPLTESMALCRSPFKEKEWLSNAMGKKEQLCFHTLQRFTAAILELGMHPPIATKAWVEQTHGPHGTCCH